mmetsp:Transcript_22098/g.28622  ORF Transcript_22098/g.28622 Transcript_22098/m.28622 type:complete len:387 (+) Transcript_22098:227-1387(+)
MDDNADIEEKTGEDHPDSLWYQIKKLLKPSEELEIQRIVGIDVIDHHRNLWNEVTSLNEILEELEKENDELQEKIRSRPGLPEHPERAMLKQQIRLILEKLQPGPVVSSKLTETIREQEIIDFVLDKDTASLRPRSVRSARSTGRLSLSSRNGSRTLNVSSRPTSARTIHSAPDMLQHMKQHLTISKVDQIIKDLKITFEEEERELMTEINELQEMIEEEMECKLTTEKGGSLEKSPTISELKSYNKKLQEKWLHDDHVKETTSKLNKVPNPPSFRPTMLPPGSSIRMRHGHTEIEPGNRLSQTSFRESGDYNRFSESQICDMDGERFSSHSFSSNERLSDSNLNNVTEVNGRESTSSRFSSRLRETVNSSKDEKYLLDDDLKYLT